MAGLLTYPRAGKPSRHLGTGGITDSCPFEIGLTVAGLSGIRTRFPFIARAMSNVMNCKL